MRAFFLFFLALSVSSTAGAGAESVPSARLFSRSTYAWPFASGPAYGEVDAARWDEPGILHTMVGSFDLRRGTPALPVQLRAHATSPYAILQVDAAAYGDGRFDRIRALLEGQGGVLLEAMAVHAHVVRVSPAVQPLLRAQAGVIALEPYHPAFKLAPSIGRVPLPDPERALSEVYRLEAVLFEGEDAHQVAAALARLGANVLQIDPDVVTFELSRQRLTDVARIDAVKAVFESLPNLLHGEETTVAMQTGAWNGGATPYHDAGVRGDGNGVPGSAAQVLMVLDSGLQLDAGDLSDTRTDAGAAGPSHRKVLLYTTAVGGTGDALGCDSGPRGGFTHGHVVAATALGNATDVAAGYGSGWHAIDPQGLPRKLDGVAPRAKLILYDAQVTPSTLSCADPEKNALSVGTLYLNDTPGSGSLGDAHARGARVFNFSWGTAANTYGTNAQRIDQFLFDHPDAAVFVSAGNDGSDDNGDLIPDASTVYDPASCKSCIVVGASGQVDTPDDGSNQEDRAGFSGVGPVGATGRIAPLLMAPGVDFGSIDDNMGLDSEYACRTQDDDQVNPVECDVVQGFDSTSFAAAAASGAALLVRDWFQQGFYPDGTASNSGNAADQVPNVSGALVKAVLVTSAQWLPGGFAVGGNTSRRFRFNHEQGYGRIQLANALPLNTYGATPRGIVISDGGLATGGRIDIPGLPGTIASAGTTQTGTLHVEGDPAELRCALAWTEDGGDALAHDLDLEMVSPSGKIYLGNFFNEDVDGNQALSAGENCHDRGLPDTLDQEIWSIETNGCGAIGGSRRDSRNPVEAIFLSPDPAGDGIGAGNDDQIETGDWSVRVTYRTGTGSQRYALSCSGPIATSSSVRFTRTAYTCGDQAVVRVLEASDPTDPAVTESEVASRVTVQVVDAGGIVRDSETGIAFTATGSRFDSVPLVLTAGTAYDPGNGVLDVRHGDRLRVLYSDESDGSADPSKLRTSDAPVDCRAHVSVADLVWTNWGRDAFTLVQGGCERDARNLFTFGFPDKFMDAGERISYRVALTSAESEDLQDFTVSLRCVLADADSPADCPPGSALCADPERRNNAPCTEMEILNSPRLVALLPAGQMISVNFDLEMAATIVGTPKVDMLLGVTARQRGRSVETLVASRHVLDVDEMSTFYSTDFPTGGVENRDFNGNETLQNPTTNLADFKQDYLFETRTYGDLTAGGTRNTSIQAPWNFDANDGGFRVGLHPMSTNLGSQVVANWGEDKNFNGVLDPGEDREPAPFGSPGILDAGWNTLGGCGWQTRGGTTGGIWHTGMIATTGGTCSVQCEFIDIVNGASGQLSQTELLLTPVVQKVHPGLDADGTATHRVEITNWAWNMAMDLKTVYDALLWELDTDTQSGTRADLFDGTVLNMIHGKRGVIVGGNLPLAGGYPAFAPFSGTTSVNGVAGNNRVGKNPCGFEVAGTAGRQANSTLAFARPEDRSDGIAANGLGDADDDADGVIDEFVTANGPIRNFDITRVDGPDLRFVTLEDLYGDAGNSFQGALGFYVAEGSTTSAPFAGYGVGIDDMVLEWREVALSKDATDCATGSCATLGLDLIRHYQGSGVLMATVLDPTPWDAVNPRNDCNGDGDYADAGDDPDCDDDGTEDVTVKASSAGKPGKIFALDRVAPGGAAWMGAIPFSTAADLPGMLYVETGASGAGEAIVQYEDRSDGTGQRCPNTADPTRRGVLKETTPIQLVEPAAITVRSVRTSDNGDDDGFADPNETVDLLVTLRNRGKVPRNGVLVRVSSNDPNVDCILQPVVYFGSLAPNETREANSPAVFRVANVNRSSPTANLTATFVLTVIGEDFETVDRPQTVTVDLDLDVSGGATPTTFTEGFEGTGLGAFTSMDLDSVAVSDRFRCQYNDPEFTNSNSYGNTQCFLSNTGYDWHVHTLSAPDGGRAFLGNNSLHWGTHAGSASQDTTRLRSLEAIRTTNPVNLGWNGVTSELSFKHQVRLNPCDSRLDCDSPGTWDRGIVQVQLADSAGAAVGVWRKIYPYENVYDGQAVDNYVNCSFDPTDDGDTEDSYFDPSDPDRRLGPSSTCAPEFSFSRQGATFYLSTFDPTDVGFAETPGLQGSRGPGTWVEPKFSLDRYRGRRLRLRFLTTSGQVSNAVTMEQAFGGNPIDADDGWYIDDLTVTNTLLTAAMVVVDTADRTGLPGCGPACSAVTALLSLVPDTTAAPGQPVKLDATTSFADRCSDGLLLFRFWIDGNGNGVLNDPEDVVLRTWTEDPILLQAPDATTRYGVEVQCSSLPSCQGSSTTVVTVPCPATGNARLPFGQTIGFASKTQLSWSTAELVDVIRGDLTALRTSGGQFNDTVEVCLANDVSTTLVTDATAPAAETAYYYLVRDAGPTAFCNAAPSWKTGVPAEKPGAGGDRDADIALDPDACP